MKRRYWFALIAIVSAGLACTALLQACVVTGPCGTVVTHPQLRMLGVVAPVALLLGGAAMISLARALWLLATAGRQVGRLPRDVWPTELCEGVTRTGADRVECLACDAPLAFCVGIVRPKILVTCGLATKLRSDELDAVLLHEEQHRRRRDPLRYALRRSVADICFFLPLARWWADRRLESAELRADRAVLERLGPRPLAGALWALGSAALPGGAAAFHQAAELRVAQVLGDPLPRRRPSRSLWLTSGTGLVVALGVASCLTQVVLALR